MVDNNLFLTLSVRHEAASCRMKTSSWSTHLCRMQLLSSMRPESLLDAEVLRDDDNVVLSQAEIRPCRTRPCAFNIRQASKVYQMWWNSPQVAKC
ncbi:hypothetical protein EYF80_040211 [Liparis tanakae]|uniref:Uncharacterized protein n=1 Tax=Liparis tanakae TaxID=230148 RepID=A0A4Z2G9F5_9TELE|nr:hypothetical protein EYF80_040211 [Liparis tanakae]